MRAFLFCYETALNYLASDRFDALRATDQRDIGTPMGKQADRHDAHDIVDLGFELLGVGNVQTVYVKDLVAIVRQHPSPIDGVTAQLFQLTRHIFP